MPSITKKGERVAVTVNVNEPNIIKKAAMSIGLKKAIKKSKSINDTKTTPSSGIRG